MEEGYPNICEWQRRMVGGCRMVAGFRTSFESKADMESGNRFWARMSLASKSPRLSLPDGFCSGLSCSLMAIIDAHVHIVGNGSGGTGCWIRPSLWRWPLQALMVRHIGLPLSSLTGDL